MKTLNIQKIIIISLLGIVELAVVYYLWLVIKAYRGIIIKYFGINHLAEEFYTVIITSWVFAIVFGFLLAILILILMVKEKQK